MGPALWMSIMLPVLLIWFLWLRSDIRHPRSQQRANLSAFIVAGFALISMITIMVLSKG